MILNFCAVCGTTEDLHQHHIVPKYVAPFLKEGSDMYESYVNNETLTLCAYHHDIIHEVKRKRWDTHGNMVKQGLAKRRAKGLPMGKKPTLTREMVNNIKQMFADGVGARETMRRLKIGTRAYYFAVRNDDSAIDEYFNSVSKGSSNIVMNIPNALTRTEIKSLSSLGITREEYMAIKERKKNL